MSDSCTELQRVREVCIESSKATAHSGPASVICNWERRISFHLKLRFNCFAFSYMSYVFVFRLSARAKKKGGKKVHHGKSARLHRRVSKVFL